MRVCAVISILVVTGLLTGLPVASAEAPANSIITEPEYPGEEGDPGTGTSACKRCVPNQNGAGYTCQSISTGGGVGKTDCSPGLYGCGGHLSCTVREV